MQFSDKMSDLHSCEFQVLIKEYDIATETEKMLTYNSLVRIQRCELHFSFSPQQQILNGDAFVNSLFNML